MGKSVIKFLAIIAVIAIVIYAGIAGLQFSDSFQIFGVKNDNGVTQGLDLKGGSVIVFEADATDPSEQDMDTVVQTIRKRLDLQGYTEATVELQGSKKVRVELPDVQNTDEAVKTLGSTAQLVFAEEVTQDPNDGNKVNVADDKIVMTGDQVDNATAEYGQADSSATAKNAYYISLKLTEDGQKKFSEATGRLVGKPIYIVMDNSVISAPNVNTKIDSDSCVITGDFTAEQAKSLAANIKAGRIPFNLNQVEVRTVSATLGEDALSRAVTAGIIGIILVMLYMLLCYRLMGFLADIALAGYLGIVLLILANFHINLTLPGIAGIILSVGMAVDANVVIFERVKEELRLGKTVRSAVDAGFNRALSAVIDSNVTTIISAVILWVLGTGTIKGFGITLFIGIVISMLSAIFISKFLLKQMIGMNVKNLWLYGISKKKSLSDVEMKGGKA